MLPLAAACCAAACSRGMAMVAPRSALPQTPLLGRRCYSQAVCSFSTCVALPTKCFFRRKKNVNIIETGVWQRSAPHRAFSGTLRGCYPLKTPNDTGRSKELNQVMIEPAMWLVGAWPSKACKFRSLQLQTNGRFVRGNCAARLGHFYGRGPTRRP